MTMHLIVRLAAAAALAGGGSMAAAISTASPPECDPGPETTQIRQDVTIAMNDGKPVFRLNGQPWLPMGLQIRGFVASKATAAYLAAYDGQGNATAPAQDRYGRCELHAARAVFGANMLRFQVSQHDLDPLADRQGFRSGKANPAPPMPAYDPAYRTQVIEAIKLARARRFVVIISMQAQKRSGVETRTIIPETSTVRAWTNLLQGVDAGGLVDDKGVMLEIYNEPGGPDQDGDNLGERVWRRWAYAGPATIDLDTSHDDTHGMQPMIDYFRATLKSKNVLIVDGLKLADTFKGVDQLADPLADTLKIGDVDQLAYAVHPYIRAEADITEETLIERFGFLHSAGSNGRPPVPVLSTEWGANYGASDGGDANGDGTLGMGTPKNILPALTVLRYFRNKGIPFGSGAMDIPGVMAKHEEGTLEWVPTTYDDDQARVAPSADGTGGRPERRNAGLLIQRLFRSNYSAGLRLEDGCTPSPLEDRAAICTLAGVPQ